MTTPEPTAAQRKRATAFWEQDGSINDEDIAELLAAETAPLLAQISILSDHEFIGHDGEPCVTSGAAMQEIEYQRHYAQAMEAQTAPLLAALEQIAALDDVEGNERLARTGSYGSFDEPGSVEIARAAIKRAKEGA